MKSLKQLFQAKLNVKHSLLVVAIGLFLAACGGGGGETPKTLLEIMSKTWRISKVTINGTADNAGNYSGYRVAFQQNGTYVVTPGGSPISITINPNNNGRWEIADNETALLFDKGTSNEFKITLVTKTETSFSIRFKVPKSINKTEPEYTIEFVTP